MKCPQYARVGNKKYKINTDFRVAIKCNEIAKDETINDFERALAIIYMLFGKEALHNENDYEQLLELARKYLSCGKEERISNDNNADMDYTQDMDLIEASFMSDYHIDLTTTKMDWWKFYNLLNGLSYSEFGNCCILNTIRALRNKDVSKIEDSKERRSVIEAQKYWSLKNKNIKLTKEQEKSMEELNKILGL